MFLQSQPTVIHHAVNIQGRDFVVGDLHGCRVMLDALLEHVRFDGNLGDRLFSVGDLVDRGPDSVGCLELLKEPWFFPVMGNHDAMLIAWILGKTKDPRQQMYAYAFTHNTGWKWVERFTRAAEFLPLLEAMPLVRVIGKDAEVSRFHVAHAEIRMPEFLGGFTDPDLDMADSLIWDDAHFIPGFDDEGDWRDHVLWGRSLIGEVQRCARAGQSLPQDRHPHLSTTYVGHTIIPPVFGPGQNEVLQVQSHVFLDSGAYQAAKGAKDGTPRFGLTLWCPTENLGWLMNGDNVVRNVVRGEFY